MLKVECERKKEGETVCAVAINGKALDVHMEFYNMIKGTARAILNAGDNPLYAKTLLLKALSESADDISKM